MFLKKSYLYLFQVISFFILQDLCWADKCLNLAVEYLPENPVVVEAGAHDGSDTFYMSHLWPKGQIYSFECHPYVFERLHHLTEGCPNVKLFQMALGANTGIADFYLSSGDAGCDAQSSLYPPSENFIWSHIHFNEKINVNVVTLDDWAKANDISEVDFLWLDLQGSEYETLKASKIILPTVKVIKTEFSKVAYYEGTVLFSEYKSWLESQGFSCIYEDDDSHGDALFIRNYISL